MATTKLQPPSPSRCSTKQYIFLALAGTLVTIIIVIAMSALFCPAEIDFSITKATHVVPKQLGGVNVGLTVAAANPGWRAAVEYRSFSVDLMYTPDKGVPSTIYGQILTVRTPFVQPPRNTTAILVQIYVAAKYWNQYLQGKTNSTTMSVKVTATVRFMIIGKAYTRLYDIAVLCDLGFSLFDNATVSFNNTTANCVAA
ncbi:uncharacterized protein LOC127777444 [Oryza glaberrima]|uniref:Uncharacterized protein n=1 Tax=Oryza barthii TaxID=65489 RepID=A0A0D3GC51_9ORYZ|nr:uncharacterized protein LOC127777444 [Oryza glaberrima]